MKMLWALVLASGVVLGACSAKPPRVIGKVIQGRVSLIGSVDASDKRLTGPGIEGVDVQVRMDAVRRGGAIVVDGKSGKDGAINLVVSDPRAFSEDVEIAASREGYVRGRQRMVLPGADRRLLIVLLPGESVPGGGP